MNEENAGQKKFPLLTFVALILVMASIVFMSANPDFPGAAVEEVVPDNIWPNLKVEMGTHTVNADCSFLEKPQGNDFLASLKYEDTVEVISTEVIKGKIQVRHGDVTGWTPTACLNFDHLPDTDGIPHIMSLEVGVFAGPYAGYEMVGSLEFGDKVYTLDSKDGYELVRDRETGLTGWVIADSVSLIDHSDV